LRDLFLITPPERWERKKKKDSGSNFLIHLDKDGGFVERKNGVGTPMQSGVARKVNLQWIKKKGLKGEKTRREKKRREGTLADSLEKELFTVRKAARSPFGKKD